jgi:hypothetical protein
VDSALAAELLESMQGMVSAAPEAHRYEHSIEVQVPMIKYLFPDAKILPVSVLPDGSAAGFGRRLGELLRGRDGIVVIGSTDLTHYGEDYGFAPAGFGPSAHEWMKQNDRRITDLAVNMLADKIVDEAERNYNACGAGAMAAAVAYAKEKGVRNGRLLKYTTSHDEYSQGGFEMAVGYAGIIF